MLEELSGNILPVAEISGDEALVDLRVCNFTVFCCCHTYKAECKISTIERRKVYQSN